MSDYEEKETIRPITATTNDVSERIICTHIIYSFGDIHVFLYV